MATRDERRSGAHQAGASATKSLLSALGSGEKAVRGTMRSANRGAQHFVQGALGLPQGGLMGAMSGAGTAQASKTPAHQRDSGYLPGRSPAEYDTDQENPDSRALNDPMSGNPNRSMLPHSAVGAVGGPHGSRLSQPSTGLDPTGQNQQVRARSAFGENIYARGDGEQLNEFTNVAPGGKPEFPGPAALDSGQAATAYGAPGSSGMDGPGGTVNTISSEAFTGVGGTEAGEAAAGRARRDFQLRAEGNAHLASDATPQEKRAGKAQEIRQQMQNLNMGTNQSLGSLAKNRSQYQQLSKELGNIQREEELGMAQETELATLAAESRENALDRASEERQALMENTLGGMPSGRTMEALRHQIATDGYQSLNKDQQMLFEQDVRETLVENSLTEMSPEELDKKVRLILGELTDGPKRVGRSLDGQAMELPKNVFKELTKSYEENPDNPEPVTIKGPDGTPQYWVMDPETQRPMQIQSPQ